MPGPVISAASLFPERKEPADPDILIIGICEADMISGTMLVYELSDRGTIRWECCERKDLRLRALRTLFMMLPRGTLRRRK